mmetsp:Transcript_16990/g.23319  ORF Transcript_16990/g.23319 Transcript_16990/m.23319 type:complete len:235 (+) Transcript_16990:1291-1995(+)
MNKLPTSLIRFFIFLFISKDRDGVVSSNISLEVADKDRNYEETEEKHDKDGVNDRVPVDLGGDEVILVEVDIPTGSPWDTTLVPLDIVGVKDFLVFINNLVLGDGITVHVVTGRARLELLSVPLRRFTVPFIIRKELVINTHRFNSETNNTVANRVGRSRLRLMVVNDNVDVVVNVSVSILDGNETNRESTSVVLLFLSCLGKTQTCRGQVVNNPIVVVTVLDVHLQRLCLITI